MRPARKPAFLALRKGRQSATKRSKTLHSQQLPRDTPQGGLLHPLDNSQWQDHYEPDGLLDDTRSVIDSDLDALNDRLFEFQENDNDGLATFADLHVAGIADATRLADYQEATPASDGDDPTADIDESSDEDFTAPSQKPAVIDTPELAAPVISAQTLFPKDISTLLPRYQREETLTDIELAFGLWAEATSLSRSEYTNLRQILATLHPAHEQITSLPLTLDTLKKHVAGVLPLIDIRQKAVALDTMQLPTTNAIPHPADNLFFFDPTALIHAILSSGEITKKMRCGLGDFVDAPKETYESRAWLSSIRTTSGKYAAYPTTQILAAPEVSTATVTTSTGGAVMAQETASRAGQPILPSDFVYFRCNKADCACLPVEGPFGGPGRLHLGQVIAVGHDHRSMREHHAPKGTIAVAIMKFIPEVDLPATFRSRVEPTFHDKELLMMEEAVHHVLESAIVPCLENICFHYQYATRKELRPSLLPDNLLHYKYFVRRIYNKSLKMANRIRPIWQSHPVRGQLEVETYGRDRLVQQLLSKYTISLPFFCFIDGFGLYRNMYRSLMGYYLVNAAFTNVERTRRSNVVPITLGPHGSHMSDVIDAIGPGLSRFEEGTKLTLNGKETTVFAFVFAFTGDMPQQLNNCGLMTQRANTGCRGCFVSKLERGKLDYDIVSKGRYHHQHKAMREHMDSLTASAQRVAYAKETGLLPVHGVPLARLSPALDMILSRPADPAHSEFGGLTELIHELLLRDILTPAAAQEYCTFLRRFPFPPGWAHIQNPMRHLGSYRLSEHGRWSIVAPILLRVWLKDTHIRPLYLAAFREVFAGAIAVIETGLRLTAGTFTVSMMIVSTLAAMARSNMQLMSFKTTPESKARLAEDISMYRGYFQDLHRAAAIASRNNPYSRVATPVAVSPAPFAGNIAMRAKGRTQGSRATSIHGSVSNSRGTSPSSSGVISPEETMLTSTEALDPQRETVRAVKLSSIEDRPNVHIGLHYPVLAAEYGLPSVANVLMGEDQHREFKNLIYATNYINPERDLLHRINIQMAVRFALGGSFPSKPELTAQLKRLKKNMPGIFSKLLPRSEKIESDDKHPSLAGLPFDAQHLQPVVSLKIQPAYCKDILRLPIRSSTMSEQLRRELVAAYLRAYGIRVGVGGLGSRPIRWFKRLSFTDPATEQRITFNRGNYIRLREDDNVSIIARLDQIFIHELPTGFRLFVRARETVQHQQGLDPITSLPLRNLVTGSDVSSLYGLPEIRSDRLYILPVLIDPSGVFELNDEATSLLHIDWDIEYL